MYPIQVPSVRLSASDDTVSSVYCTGVSCQLYPDIWHVGLRTSSSCISSWDHRVLEGAGGRDWIASTPNLAGRSLSAIGRPGIVPIRKHFFPFAIHSVHAGLYSTLERTESQ